MLNVVSVLVHLNTIPGWQTLLDGQTARKKSLTWARTREPLPKQRVRKHVLWVPSVTAKPAVYEVYFSHAF